MIIVKKLHNGLVVILSHGNNPYIVLVCTIVISKEIYFPVLWYLYLADMRVPGQDGGRGECCACLLPWPHQNYNEIIEQSSQRTTWRLAEWKSYN